MGLLWLAAWLGGAASAAGAAGSQPLLEARVLIERSIAAVSASSRARGEQAERRAEAVTRAGHEHLGAGYNVVEAHEVLERMYVWLASDGRRARVRDVRTLLETAARASYPGIADGSGAHGARHWADFVLYVTVR